MQQRFNNSIMAGYRRYHAYYTRAADNSHIFGNTIIAAAVNGNIVIGLIDGIVDNPRYNVAVLLFINGIHNLVLLNGIHKKRTLEHTAQTGILFCQAIVHFVKTQVTFKLVYLCVQRAGNLVLRVNKRSFLKRVVFNIDKQGAYLKNQKQEKRVILSDKNQEVTHREDRFEMLDMRYEIKNTEANVSNLSSQISHLIIALKT